MQKIYQTKFGIPSKRWQAYVSEIFEVDLIYEDDEKVFSFLKEKYPNLDSGRGSKFYVNLLKLANDDKISLSKGEINALKKAVEWNSAVSGYYSIVNKLKEIGLIKKENGMLKRDESFFNNLTNLKKFLSEEEKDYVLYEGR